MSGKLMKWVQSDHTSHLKAVFSDQQHKGSQKIQNTKKIHMSLLAQKMEAASCQGIQMRVAPPLTASMGKGTSVL